MDWQDKEGPTPEGEKLVELYQRRADEREYRREFGDGVRIASLERKARELRRKFDLGERPQTPEEADELVMERVRKPRILFYDIETTDLGADWGMALMMGYRWNDEEEPHMLSILDYDLTRPEYKGKPLARDRELVQDMIAILDQADVQVGHCNRQAHFDRGFINYRAVLHRLPPPQDIAEIDTFDLAKDAFGWGVRSKRLKGLTHLLGTAKTKEELPLEVWRDSKYPELMSEEAWEALKHYCLMDVESQRELTLLLAPYARRMPGYQILNGETLLACNNPFCGSEDIEHVGWRYTKLMKYARYKCHDCGKNMRGRMSVFDKNIPRLTE